MKYSKVIGSLGLIGLSAFVGAYLTSMTDNGIALSGAILGALLGVILLAFINWFVSRRSEGVRPVTDSHQVKNGEKIESSGARYRRMKEAQLEDFLRFPPKGNITL